MRHVVLAAAALLGLAASIPPALAQTPVVEVTEAWARAGVQELWLVNLVDRRIDVLWKPDAEAFQDAMVLATPTTLTARSLPNVTLAVGALFGL